MQSPIDPAPELFPVRLWLLKLKIRQKNGEIETRRFLSESSKFADIDADLQERESEVVDVVYAIAAREYIQLHDDEIFRMGTEMERRCERELRDFLEASDPLPMSRIDEILGNS